MGRNNGDKDTTIRGIKGQGITNSNSSSSITTETAGTDTTSSTNRPEEKIIPRHDLVKPKNVVIELPTGDAADKKKKNRPTGMKYNKDKKEPKGTVNQETLILVNTVIAGAFVLASAKLGNHWQLTQQEQKNISDPAARIIAKYFETDKLEQFSDPMMLMFALGSAIVPRVIVSASQKKGKEEKKNEPTATQPIQQPGISSETVQSSRHDNKSNSGNNVTHEQDVNFSNVKSILESVSAANY